MQGHALPITENIQPGTPKVMSTIGSLDPPLERQLPLGADISALISSFRVTVILP